MPLKIGILTTQDVEENRLLVEAAEKRGHQATLLYHTKCSLSICQNSPEIYYEGQPIGKEFDIIIPRVDKPHPEYALTVLRQFEAMHIFTSETARAISIARDKLLCAQRLLKENIPFPSTGFAYSKEDFHNIIKTVGGVPLIIKLVEGTEGVGVFLADDMKHAVNLLKTFKQLSTPLIAQKFIEESSGKDIRAFVCGGRVMAAIQRESEDNDFRANVSQGGIATVIKLTEEEEEICIKAARALKINVAGVDLIRSNQGPLIIEINASLNFARKYMEDAGIDAADIIVGFAVDKYKEGLKNAA
ncbi:MAG: hypothetical protein COB36_13940 [Alphaproteobacteria bacterium]|nr:MAG: hypothetical protein COB36_13940 [Alphaproteobacteria bacterium]